MGLFSSKKSTQPSTTDKVWKTNAACLKGTATQALLSIKNGDLPLIVTLFEESHKKLLAFLDSQAVPYQAIDNFNDIDLLQSRNTIAVWQAFAPGAFNLSIHKEIVPVIYVLGRYPAMDFENKLIESLFTHFPQSRISYCLSLDDPSFQIFGAENIKTIMGSLGMKDDECIEHAMVSKAIKRALEKTNQGLTLEIKARSEEEWYAKNVRDRH